MVSSWLGVDSTVGIFGWAFLAWGAEAFVWTAFCHQHLRPDGCFRPPRHYDIGQCSIRA